MSSDASPQQAALAGAANEDAAIVLSQESMDALALFELLLLDGPGLNRRHADKLNSMGYDDDCIIAIARNIWMLRDHTSTLLRCTQVPLDGYLNVGPLGLYHEGRIITTVQHDDVLLPAWKLFADALSSVPSPADNEGYLRFVCAGTQMDNAVMGMLLEAFKTSPLRVLGLTDNDMGSTGMSFLTSALETATTIEEVFISYNTIESEAAASSFGLAVLGHPRLEQLAISNCAIGQNDAVMAAIAPVLNSNNLRIIRMNDNGIGLHGARLISACLSDNPAVESFDLYGNLLNDDAAKMIATSLQTNTNLRTLRLVENPITDCGILALTKAVFDTTSLNAVYDSNHTCWIFLDKRGFPNSLNTQSDPDANRKLKLSEMMCPYQQNTPNAMLLEGFQIEVMPRVLTLVPGNIFRNPLDTLFKMIREWNMPLLFARSRHGVHEVGGDESHPYGA